ncbi:MAG: hypothetical protein AVO38_14325 [delta proteobacterium ML8_D]|jgi:hypothetical protein|nr:MAG: hypothetical protein AVO38_14325 [delta proteobacterium ML8_D]
MDIRLSKNLVQDKICQMIYRAETFLHWSSRLFDMHKKGLNNCGNSRENQYKFYNCTVNNYNPGFEVYIKFVILLQESKN